MTTATEPSLVELVRRIEATHHASTRRLLDDMALLVGAANEHSATSSLGVDAIAALRRVFTYFRADLLAHLRTEEIAVFPYIVALAEAVEQGTTPRKTLFSSIASPIQVMRNEQDGTRRGIARLRRALELARATAPDATDYSALTSAARAIERDLEAHVALEQDVLFPRAIQLEQLLSASRAS